MAPEVLINNKFNIKCDLWSIGVIFYEMLYGYVPYDKPRNINELKKMIETQHISFPSNYSENVIMFFPYNYSEKVIILVKSLLQYDPLKRIDWIDFFDNDIFKNPEKKISSPINIPNNLNINKSNYIDKDGEEMYKDYIVINQQEIEKLKTYYSYKEESSSIIKILSESYNYLFGTSPKSI
jgi:hypothetical protein